MTNQEKLFRLAYIARKNVEYNLPQFDPDLGGACGIASHHLMQLAKANGIQVHLCYGTFNNNFHFWVEYGNKIIDITATQFGINKKVYCCNKCEEYNTVQKTTKTRQAIDMVCCFSDQYPDDLKRCVKKIRFAS